MEITADKVKELRERTGIGMMECKSALSECGCDMDKAIEILRKKGYARAEAKSSRAAKEGFIGSYIHMNGRIGVQFRATKSDSQLTSTRTPIRPFMWM